MTHDTLSSIIDSQFGAAAQAGPIHPESPLAALGLLALFSQWNPHTMRIDFGDIEWISMETLGRGQQNCPEVQELYRATRSGMPSRWDFWLLVVRSCGARRANLDEAQIRMCLQALNEPESINFSQAAWKASRLLTDPELKKFFQIVSMYHLLMGQRHSADTMQLYRACFKESPDELFRRVELITPLDLEEIAIDLESRRKVAGL
jgi:hypothetical protein